MTASSKKTIVQKYGGSTLATPEKIKSVATEIAKLASSGHRIVVAVSAMGSSTNELIELAHKVSVSPNRRELDMLLSTGERTSMALMSMALHDLSCEAISFTGSQAGILTTDSHFNARIVDVKAFRVEEALSSKKVVVLAGFQGVCPETKEITTLGRGGTDTTAVAMAAYLHADRCEILKDVDGVMSADPKVIPEAKTIPLLNLNQMLEMSLWGAKVIHHRAVQQAISKNVDLYVGPVDNPNRDHGTQIISTGVVLEADVTSLADCKALAINSHEILTFSDTTESQVLNWNFPNERIEKILDQREPLLSTTESAVQKCSVSVTWDKKASLELQEKLRERVTTCLSERVIPFTDSFSTPYSSHILLTPKHRIPAIQILFKNFCINTWGA